VKTSNLAQKAALEFIILEIICIQAHRKKLSRIMF